MSQVQTASFCALGTKCLVAVVGSGRAAIDAARSVVMTELDGIDLTCSRFRSDSELVRLNARAGKVTPVSDLLFEALQVALRAADATDGLVDPTIGKTLRLAGYDAPFTVVRGRDGRLTRTSFVQPQPARSSVMLDDERRTVELAHGVELDLGATAKALAADRCARASSQRVGSGVLVSLGGDIATAGKGPPRGWSIRLADDNASSLDDPGPKVAIFDGAVASSGTTVRRWTTANADLHHIIDPRTGRPALSPWKTVSVAAATCVDANTASTAAIILGDDAPNWLATRQLPARLVRHDGTPWFVSGWPDDGV